MFAKRIQNSNVYVSMQNKMKERYIWFGELITLKIEQKREEHVGVFLFLWSVISEAATVNVL